MRDELNALVHSVRRRFFLSPKVMDFMPAVPEMQRTLERGRYLYDGYQRSSSLKYGSLGDLVTRDPIYRKARAASRLPGVRSVVDEERFHNLFLIIKFFMRDLKSQNVIEFGAYKGGSAIFLATLLAEYYPSARMLSLDTFAGIPESKEGVDTPPQDFAASNLDWVRKTVRSIGLKNLEFVQGKVQDTALDACRRLGVLGLAHIDVVLYEPSIFAQNIALEFLAPGGYLIQDDALEPNCVGATLAAEELIRERGLSIEQIWPQMVFRAGPSSPSDIQYSEKGKAQFSVVPTG